ncbi:MAG: prepilin-type N-terminal cleavage/methylation domain-containing protein [Planctomycetes bacterium]|nr:prepilin-type N-terminal cleavage/methylation domain-containing protein [Planctomycetota bacterium]
MMRRTNKRAAFTLLEVLLVVTLLAILASVVVPAAQTQPTPTLKSTARAFVSDLRYARSLAIQYNAPVIVRFDPANGTYEIAWSDSNRGPLPWGIEPTRATAGPVQRRLNPGPVAGFTRAPSRFVAIFLKQSKQPVSDLTFTPTGGTGPARNEDTIIWIAQGSDRDVRFVRIRISWVTGLIWLDPPTSQPPPTISGRGTASAYVGRGSLGNSPKAPFPMVAQYARSEPGLSPPHPKERQRA